MVEKIQLLIVCVCFFLFTNKGRDTAGSQYRLRVPVTNLNLNNLLIHAK